MSRIDGVKITETYVSIFGEKHPPFMDMRPLTGEDGRMPEAIIVATSVPGGLRPRSLLLPHQLYTDDARRILSESGHRELWVYPVFDSRLWTQVIVPEPTEPESER